MCVCARARVRVIERVYWYTYAYMRTLCHPDIMAELEKELRFRARSPLFLSPIGTNATALVKQNRNEYYLLLIRAKKERKTKEQKENGKLSADETPDSRARLEGDDSFRHRVFLFRHDGELYCDALSLEISIHIIIHIIICFIGAEP